LVQLSTVNKILPINSPLPELLEKNHFPLIIRTKSFCFLNEGKQLLIY
jgi:hypothetical protein